MSKRKLMRTGSKSYVWTTKDGRKIAITDMDNEHLLNAQRMLVRQEVKYEECLAMYLHPFWEPRDDMAEMEAAQAMDSMFDTNFIRMSIIKVFNKEIKSRGLVAKEVNKPKAPPKIKSVVHFAGGTICQLEK